MCKAFCWQHFLVQSCLIEVEDVHAFIETYNGADVDHVASDGTDVHTASLAMTGILAEFYDTA